MGIVVSLPPRTNLLQPPCATFRHETRTSPPDELGYESVEFAGHSRLSLPHTTNSRSRPPRVRHDPNVPPTRPSTVGPTVQRSHCRSRARLSPLPRCAVPSHDPAAHGRGN